MNNVEFDAMHLNQIKYRENILSLMRQLCDIVKSKSNEMYGISTNEFDERQFDIFKKICKENDILINIRELLKDFISDHIE